MRVGCVPKSEKLSHSRGLSFNICMKSRDVETAYLCSLCLIVELNLINHPLLSCLWLLLSVEAVIVQALFRTNDPCTQLYTTRKSSCQGIFIGLVSVPCLLLGIAISSPQPSVHSYWIHVFHASCCCSLCLASFIAKSWWGSLGSLVTLIAVLSPLSLLRIGGTEDFSLPLNSLLLPLLTIPSYHLILKHMKQTFTFGEAAIACQGTLLLSSFAVEILLGRIGKGTAIQPGSFATLVCFWIIALALSAWTLVYHRHSVGPCSLLALILLTISTISLTDLASWILFVFLPFKPLLQQRMLIILYWLILNASALPLMSHAAKWVRRQRREGELNHKSCLSLLRKGYHILLLAIFLPVTIIDQDMICVSSAIAFAAMIFVEVIRCSGLLPSKSKNALDSFMGSFTDERDAGSIFTTHLSLLLGASVPIWMSTLMDLGPILTLSGLVCLGVGDTAASVAGILLPGKLRLFEDSNKTIQGALAGLISMLLFWYFSGISNLLHPLHLILATSGAALLEASTHQVDNLVLPLAFMAHLLLSQGQRVIDLGRTG